MTSSHTSSSLVETKGVSSYENKTERRCSNRRMMMGLTNIFIKGKIVIFCSLCFFSSAITAEQITAILVKDVQLRASPSLKAESVGLLLKDSQVTILKRTGGWYQVKTPANSTAWLSMLRVRFKSRTQPAGQKSSNKGFVSLRQGHSNITATTGVRGIGESEIKNAKPDLVSLYHAEGYRVTLTEAKVFAKQGKLVAQSIDYQESSHD